MAKQSDTPEPAAVEPADTRVARVLTLVGGVSAKNFTFGKDQTVPGVPIKHAEFLEGKGEVRILEVS